MLALVVGPDGIGGGGDDGIRASMSGLTSVGRDEVVELR
jgi:hypothetical protein